MDQQCTFKLSDILDTFMALWTFLSFYTRFINIDTFLGDEKKSTGALKEHEYFCENYFIFEELT